MAMSVETISNETLCLLIAEGRTELLGILWEQSKKLAFFFLRKITTKEGGKLAMEAGGVTEEDLQTIAFLAVSRASRAYQKEKGYRYSKALEYAVKTEFYEATGQRTPKAQAEPLRGALSLDKQANEESGNDDFLSFLVDKESEKPFEEIDNDLNNSKLRNVLDRAMENTLTERERYVLEEHYYKGKTLSKIADILNVSPTAVSYNRKNAFKKLQQDYELRAWYGYDRQRDLLYKSLQYWRNQQVSIPEIALERVEYLEKLLKTKE